MKKKPTEIEAVNDQIHRELADRLLEMLRGDHCETCGRTGPGAKELTVIRQFLADNGVTADLRSRTPLHRLAEAGDLPSFDPDERVERTA